MKAINYLTHLTEEQLTHIAILAIGLPKDSFIPKVRVQNLSVGIKLYFGERDHLLRINNKLQIELLQYDYDNGWEDCYVRNQWKIFEYLRDLSIFPK